MRFKCVSKLWRFLISTDSSLARLHIQRTASLDRPFLLIEKHEGRLFDNYWVDLHSVEDRIVCTGGVHNPFDDGFGRDAEVLSSCHGLLVLQQHPSLKLAVSNPTTKTHRMVPPNPAGDGNVVFCGFGYDQVHDCYKLVTRVESHSRDGSVELMVYDLDKDSWRRLEFGTWWRDLEDPDDLGSNGLGSYYDSYECVDGGLYWCIDPELSDEPREIRTMVCFVLGEEEFHAVKTPCFGEVKFYPNMCLLEGRLGLVCEALDRRVEIWSIEMGCDDDDGKRQWRWTRLLAMLDPYAILPPYIDFLDALIPVCFSACKKKILFRVKELLFWYDMGKKRFGRLSNVNSRCYGTRSCVRSLVGVGGFGSIE